LRGGESGSNARWMARLTCRMRAAESGRGKRSPRRDFLSVVMKWPLSQDGPGSPVSPGSNRTVVGASAPWLPKGTIKTESTRSLIFRESSDTTNTQWRTAGAPSIAAQISPRRGGALWLVKIHLLRCGAQGIFEIVLFCGCLSGHTAEISRGLTLQSSPIVEPASHFHDLIYRLSDAVGPAGPHHSVQVGVAAGANRGR